MVIDFLDLLILIFCLIFLYGLKQKQMQLSWRILLGMLLGVGYSFLLRLTPTDWLFNAIKDFLYLLGHGYLALLKMLVIPLILTSIIHAILNLGFSNGNTIKKISCISVGMLLIMTSLASFIGLMTGKLFAVGVGLNMPDFASIPEHEYKGLMNTLLNMLPTNPFAVLVQENTVAVVILAILIGIAARTLDIADHDKMNTFKQIIVSLFAIVKRLTSLILSFTPFGIFALISLLLLAQGLSAFFAMLNFIVAMYVAMIIVMIMHTSILACFGINPLIYFKRALDPLFVAFSTRSSFGTLPVTEETLREEFQTSQVIATFVPSLGATMGMNACAGIFPAMLVVMTLTIMHQPLTPHLILMVMFINAIASLGISGIPGTAYIAATVTLTSLNLPYAIIGLVQGIDPIIDMGRTAVNVNGVMTTALVADHFSHTDHR